MARAKTSITKIGGKFRIDVTDSRGKRHRPAFATKSEAKAALDQFEGQKDRGEFLRDQSKRTFSDALDLLLVRNKREGLAKASQLRVASIVSAHLRPTFGHLKLSEFRAKRMVPVQEWFDGRARDHGAAAMSLAHARSYIKQALDEAIRAGFLGSPNPMLEFNVRVPQINKPEERKVLTLDEIFRLVTVALRRDHSEHEAASRVRFLLVLFGLLLGLRDQETGAVCWDCVNLDERTVHVRRKIEGGKLVDSTKTGRKGFRTVPMSPLLYAALLAYRQEMQSQGREVDGPVPVLRPGRAELVTQGAVGDHWTRLVKKAGLKDHTYYSLRHTALNLWRTIGIPIDRLCTLAGHTNINTTHSRYLHETPHFEIIRREVHALGLEQTPAGLIDGLGIVLARHWQGEGLKILCAPPRSMTPQVNGSMALLSGNVIDIDMMTPAVIDPPAGPVIRSMQTLRAWQVAQAQTLHAQGWVKHRIADHLGLCKNTISDWIRTVPDARWFRKTSLAEKAAMKQAVAEYRDLHPEASSTAIAERFGIKPYMVARWEKARGLRMRHQPGDHKLGRFDAQIREMLAADKTYAEIAKAIGHSKSAVAYFAHRHGLAGQYPHRTSGRNLEIYKDRIIALIAEGKSDWAISRELDEASYSGIAGFIERNALRRPAESNENSAETPAE